MINDVLIKQAFIVQILAVVLSLWLSRMPWQIVQILF